MFPGPKATATRHAWVGDDVPLPDDAATPVTAQLNALRPWSQRVDGSGTLFFRDSFTITAFFWAFSLTVRRNEVR